jgi:hypothetical protein
VRATVVDSSLHEQEEQVDCKREGALDEPGEDEKTEPARDTPVYDWLQQLAVARVGLGRGVRIVVH